jgi:DNA-binding NarL/FixJ family response regulator
MTESNSGGDRVVRFTHILLIDDDPIFRLGLRAALEAFPDFQVVAEADTGTEALELLGRLVGENAVDLAVLELALGRSHPNEQKVESSNIQPSTPFLSGLQLCQQLKAEYPNLPVLLLSAENEPLLLMSAKESGVEGYCAKGSAIAKIVQAMRQLMSGQSYWQTLPQEPLARASSVRPPRWHHQLRQSGLQQIEDALALVTQQLQNPKLSNLDWLFWSGRRRELLAARWVVNQLLPTDVIVVEPEQAREGEGEQRRNLTSRPLSSKAPIPNPQSSISGQMPSALSPAPTSQLSRMPPQTPVFEVTLGKLQSGLSNLTGVVLEIDILATEKRWDLLSIVLHKFEDILDELRFSQVTLEQLPQKRSLVLQDLWQVSLMDFFGKYYTLPVDNNEFEVVNVLQQNVVFVQVSILDKIPLVVELLAHQLFETPLIIDNVSYPARTPEAMAQAEILLQNLIIQVANAVIQPLLNEFADIETIKQSFYDRRLISSREIARFRNNLSWRYRLSQLLLEPQAIFDSRYDLFVLSDTGIKQTSIYSPRRQELEQLRGIRLAVTLAYETRDAIAPRLRAAIRWAGSGVVYILTQVLGKSIGLIVRGVIQGIGSTLQETRFGKNGERGK